MPAGHRLLGFWSAPVVDEIDAGPVIAGRVGLLHHDSLKVAAEAVRQHLAIGFVPRRIDPGDKAIQALLCGESVARIEQSVEILRRLGSWQHGAELDIARVASRLASWSTMADGQPYQLRMIPQEDRIA